MKSINKIVISEQEPQKDCLWIKDNAFYMFGSNGWQKVNDNKEVVDKINQLIKRDVIEIPDKFSDISEKIHNETYSAASVEYKVPNYLDFDSYAIAIKDAEGKMIYIIRDEDINFMGHKIGYSGRYLYSEDSVDVNLYDDTLQFYRI